MSKAMRQILAKLEPRLSYAVSVAGNETKQDYIKRIYAAFDDAEYAKKPVDMESVNASIDWLVKDIEHDYALIKQAKAACR